MLDSQSSNTRFQSSESAFKAYVNFTKRFWGVAVTGATLVNPLNFAAKIGLGISFIPVFGNFEFAVGLATFFSIFVVLAMFNARTAILRLSNKHNPVFWVIFVAFFGLGAGLLYLYVKDRPADYTGAFVYAIAFMLFTATFHLHAVRAFVDLSESSFMNTLKEKLAIFLQLPIEKVDLRWVTTIGDVSEYYVRVEKNGTSTGVRVSINFRTREWEYTKAMPVVESRIKARSISIKKSPQV